MKARKGRQWIVERLDLEEVRAQAVILVVHRSCVHFYGVSAGAGKTDPHAQLILAGRLFEGVVPQSFTGFVLDQLGMQIQPFLSPPRIGKT